MGAFGQPGERGKFVIAAPECNAVFYRLDRLFSASDRERRQSTFLDTSWSIALTFTSMRSGLMAETPPSRTPPLEQKRSGFEALAGNP